MRQIVFTVIIAFALTPQAAGQDMDLTAEAARRFVDTLSETHALGREVEQRLDDTMLPVLGERFAPYSAGMANLKANEPAAYGALAGMVSAHGFSDVESWARTGDAVITAYLAYKAGDRRAEMAQMRQQLTPEMLSRMPAGMRPQMEAALAMAQAIEAVPDSHVRAIAPLAPDLESAFDVAMPMPME